MSNEQENPGWSHPTLFQDGYFHEITPDKQKLSIHLFFLQLHICKLDFLGGTVTHVGFAAGLPTTS